MSISRKLSSRILAILLGVTTAFTVMSKITAYAASVEESDGNQIALKEITEN